MAKRKEKISLPNGCYISRPQVHPLNWNQTGASLKKEWYIHYRFYDPLSKEYLYGLARMVKGMNSETTLEDKREVTKQIIKDEIFLLKKGYNPITKSYTTKPLELSPYTPFINALWIAVEKVKAVPNYRIDLKSIVKGIEAAIKELDLNIPVAQVTRKSIYKILEKCSELNKKWSARRHNAYRTALIIFFKYLIRMEAADSNPAREIDKMAETKKVRVTLTDQEAIKVNDYLHENYYNFWRFLQIFYASGARETELLRLQIKDVDLKNQTFKILIKKGAASQEVLKAIQNDILYLWKEVIGNNPKEYFVFSTRKQPGVNEVRADKISRFWRIHVKKKLGITADFYAATKHRRTTRISGKHGSKIAAKLNSHKGEGMVRNIYDTDYKNRELEKMKNIKDSFAG